MMVSQYFGVSNEASSMQAMMLQHMRFRIRTALGDSKNFYQHSAMTAIHRTGQGSSCASPEIWLLVSSLLMDCLSQRPWYDTK
jgi:hypothetical protein